jgi:hypothetical protein
MTIAIEEGGDLGSFIDAKPNELNSIEIEFSEISENLGRFCGF